MLCFAPVRDHLKFSKHFIPMVLGVAAVFWLAFSLFGAVLGANSNALLWWAMLLAFCLYQRALGFSFSLGRSAFAFTTSTMVISMCRMLAVVINARAELNNQRTSTCFLHPRSRLGCPPCCLCCMSRQPSLGFAGC